MNEEIQRIPVKIEKICEDAKVPDYAHFEEGDAGADLYSNIDYLLRPKEFFAVPLGFKMEIPKGYQMEITPKSGIAANHGVTVLNSPGTVDCSYRGEVKAIMINHSGTAYEIKKGAKIAQGKFKQAIQANFIEGKVNDTKRGDGGFGSTGDGLEKRA